ncbi:MAG TPA: DUF885 family protein [Rhizomicrobium sp.]|nr:DUF885 family protein [Rhizomicrobium sp.]
MRIWIAALACAGAAVTVDWPAMAAGNDADAKFKAIYTREWAWREQQFAGEDDDDRRKIADHLPKVDAATQAMRLAYWQNVMHALDGISPASLSHDAQVDYAVYKPQIQVLINDQLFRDYEMPANSDTAFWSNVTSVAQRKFRTADDYRRYISFLNDIPRYFSEETANMRAGLARGFTQPKIVMTGRDKSISSVSEAGSTDKSPLYAPFKKMPDTIPAGDQKALQAEGAAAIAKSAVPAYATLLKFVRDEYIPKCRTVLAAESLPNGKAFYRAKIQEFTTLDMDPDTIHKFGLAEVASIHAHMLDVMHQTGFKGDFPAFLNYLRTDPKFYAKTPEELLKDAAWIAKRFDGVSGQYFGYLPRQRFAIKPVPADIAPFYTSGRGGPGVYLVNTYDLPARPLYNMTALTLHESAPGHAFQIPIAAEHKDQPAFRRDVYISAYGEGWAFYTEKLGVEMNMYETPYDMFGMWTYQAWRACRLVVDTGIHSQGWTREQAQKYLHDNTALTDHEIETEVDRYIGWPGQALSYYLGAADIWKNRARAEKALGPKFNIRAFHDTVLELGSVPLPVIDKRIDRFIAEGGKGPYPDME